MRGISMIRDLDDVLDAYAASDGGPSRDALEAWVKRYPQYEEELTAFTIDWIHMNHVEPAAPTDELETLVLRGMSVVQQLLHAQRSHAAGTSMKHAPGAEVGVGNGQGERRSDDHDAAEGTAIGAIEVPRSLLGAAAERGLPPDAFARATGLTVTLLRALSNRVVIAATVPLVIVDAIGRALGYARSAIAQYLALPATLSAGAAYKADRAPRTPPQRAFAELVQMDPELGDAEKRALLALCRDAP